MRPIDADALIAWIKGSQQMTSKMKCVIAKIETMPDAVSVVHADCNGCKFVGWYDTEFPCVNCIRKTKDYYTKDEPQTERSSE